MTETKQPPKPPQEEQFDIQETYTKTEQFVNKNKQAISIVITVIIVAVAAYLGYKKFHLEPLEQDAQQEIFMAQHYFNQDSLHVALNGDGNYLGFLGIIDEYGATKAANLSHYYAGISYLHLGQYQQALDHLEEFDSDDVIVASIAKGAMGDAYWELGDVEEAIDNYLKAADINEDEFTSPLYLMRAGRALEEAGKFAEAKDAYEKIKNKYPDSEEGRQIDKYIARVETKLS